MVLAFSSNLNWPVAKVILTGLDANASTLFLDLLLEQILWIFLLHKMAHLNLLLGSHQYKSLISSVLEFLLSLKSIGHFSRTSRYLLTFVSRIETKEIDIIAMPCPIHSGHHAHSIIWT